MHVNLFDLNLIRSLSALLAERNVTRAAEKLGTTQQAMSHSLRRLRDYFDDPLLLRVGRRFELSPLASALEVPVRELMLQVVATIERRPTFDPASSRHRFRIAMSDYAQFVILPGITRILARRAPSITCDLSTISPDVFSNLERGDLDLCVMPSNPRPWLRTVEPWLRSQHLFSDDFVCAVSKNHPDIDDTIDLEQYVRSKHAVVQFNSHGRTVIHAAWTKCELDPDVSVGATSFSTLPFILSDTELVATLQRRIALVLEDLAGVKILECPVPIEPLHETLDWHERNHSDLAHAFIREVFAEAAAELSPYSSTSATRKR